MRRSAPTPSIFVKMEPTRGSVSSRGRRRDHYSQVLVHDPPHALGVARFELERGGHHEDGVCLRDMHKQAADAPGNVAGFSLHAGVAAQPSQRDKLERPRRYGCRPPVSEKRLFITPRGAIGYPLKTPYRDGTTYVLFEPLDFIASWLHWTRRRA